MKVAWFSAGVSSLCAALLAKDVDKIIYTHIDDQHEDSLRFLSDSEKLLGRKIDTLQSPYKNVDNVARTFGYVNGTAGARCTAVLKRRVRKEWEREQAEPITHVWGFDSTERDRADRLIELSSDVKHEFPLIKAELTKSDCHGMIKRQGIRRPYMYDLGYSNNNCIACIKGGMGYFNKIRRDFPDAFKRRAEMERDVGHTCINGCYLDELDPQRGRANEVIPECSMLCELALLAAQERGGDA